MAGPKQAPIKRVGPIPTPPRYKPDYKPDLKPVPRGATPGTRATLVPKASGIGKMASMVGARPGPVPKALRAIGKLTAPGQMKKAAGATSAKAFAPGQVRKLGTARPISKPKAK